MNYIKSAEAIKKLAEKVPNTRQRFGIFGSLLLVCMCVFLHLLSIDQMQQVLAKYGNLSSVFLKNEEVKENEEEATSDLYVEEDTSISTYQVTEDNTPMFSQIETYPPLKVYREGDILTELPVNPDNKEDTTLWKFVIDYSGNLGWIQATKLKELKGEKITVMTVNATSSYTTKKTKEVMKPEYIIDGLMDTSWQEGVKGIGQGEMIHMSFAGEEKINELIIINGNVSTEDKYLQNNRLKTATLRFSDGSSQEINFKDEYSLTGTKVTLDTPIASEWIELVIEEVYRGSKYNDTCIGEMIALR